MEKAPTTQLQSLSPGAHAIAALGERNEEIVHRQITEQTSFFGESSDSELKKLAAALEKKWRDEEAAKVVNHYFTKLDAGEKIDINSLGRWVLSHPNDAEAVIDCMNVSPPKEISIIRLLSRAGSQKLVFLSTWRLTQHQVVLKRLTGPVETVNRILLRELQAHPLSLVHKNIIETHHLENAKGESFLVERYLPVVLNDEWRSGGLQEAANLLYDIASALLFLQNHERVHGDIKPDNIGKKNSDYILLDFGICRHTSAFTPEATPTGSLRTRPPELILANANQEIEDLYKIDVWAHAATVFNAIVGRFPLFNVDEYPPRVSHLKERNKFEKMLAKRIESEWDKFVTINELPEVMRNVLSNALQRDPGKRCSAEQLLECAMQDLSVYLRASSQVGHFSPIEELRQLKDYLPDANVLRLMPISAKHSLRGRLEKLKEIPGFESTDREEIERILNSVL